MVVDAMSTYHFDVRLGGPGTVVRIDEAMFGSRKYNRGRMLNQHWVVGLIQDDREDIVMEVVQKRNKETLHGIINRYVLAGTEICTDSWKGYLGLDPEKYHHSICNHSDPEHRFVGK